jgi:hypothetical protein
MPLNFTLQDILGTTLAFCLFPLVIVFPGYVFGWAFNLFEFRARLLPTRFAISLLLSVAISPILYYLLSSMFSLNVALIATIFIALVFAILIIREKPTLPQNWPWRTLLFIFLGWLALSIFSLVDLQSGNNELYFSVTSYDHTTRVSIIDAMTRTGIPPINPSYYPGHYVKLTFLYFFWYILGSVIDFAGGSFINARTALFASIIWCGFALMAMIAFYLRLRNGRDCGKIWQYAFIGIASLLVTGLDILLTLTFMRFGNGVIGDLEHWNEQITAWLGSLLWVPHHVASLIAGFVGVMLVHSARGQSRKKQFIALIFSGMAFASALGLSVWVTLVFVLFWAIWMLFLYLQKEQRALLLPMTIAGVAALLLSGPFLLGLLSGGSGEEAGSFPIALTVRSFSLADVYLENSSLLWKSLVRLIFLPLNYFLELGFFLLTAFVWLKSHKDKLRINPYYFAEILLLSVSFFVGTFTRSTIIENNDLGWRAWLPGQFVLLIWGVDVLSQFTASPQKLPALSSVTRYNLVVLIVLGFATTVLDVALLRFGYYFAFGSEVGRPIFSARQTYAVINQTLPESAIVQYNPSSFINRPSGLYGMRQSAISDRTAYGIPLGEYTAKVEAVSEIFMQKNVQNWNLLDVLCKQHSIDVLVIVNSDPLWASLPILETQRASLYADDYYAAFTCGGYNASPLTP